MRESKIRKAPINALFVLAAAVLPSLSLAQSPETFFKVELGRELMLEHPDIDMLIYACPHWANIESLEPLEQEFGINVITALQAIIWEGLRLSGVPYTVANYVRLLREH